MTVSRGAEMTGWFADLLRGVPNGEWGLVERYSSRLMDLAKNCLPERIRRRVDPEDVVQSVYRSFFRRLRDGEFQFDDSHDVWRLLTVITYRKARNAVKYHLRGRRDIRRDVSLVAEDQASPLVAEHPPSPTGQDVAMMFECLEQMLADLPERYRAIVVRRMQGESIESIANSVKRSRRTVFRVLAHLEAWGAEQIEKGA